jgi:hypothetical protein
MAHTCGWGPAGSQAIVQAEALEHIHRWLPGDPRFEIRDVQGKQTILFGQSDRAIGFALEWQQMLENSSASHIADSLRRMMPVQRSTTGAPVEPLDQTLDLKLIWLIPNVSPATDARVMRIAEDISKKIADPKRFSFLPIRGIERATRDDSGRWTLELLHADDSTVELSGEAFAAFPNARPTSSIGKELRSQTFAFPKQAPAELAPGQPTFYADWPGWQVATEEPQYYRLGSIQYPNDPKGLPESYQQIRDLFALLGARANLNLYEIV